MRSSAVAVLFVGVVVVTAAGCFRATSSAPILGPGGSSAVMRRAPGDAAIEVARLFAQRGFSIVDQQPHAQGGVRLRLKGARRTVRDGDELLEVGSAFHVFVVPHAAGAAIALVGRPTFDGAELCTDDRLGGPCVDRYVTLGGVDLVDGHAEAEVVHGVLSELRLHGAVDDTIESPYVATATTSSPCEERRRRQLEHAMKVKDMRQRAIAYAGVQKATAECE